MPPRSNRLKIFFRRIAAVLKDTSSKHLQGRHMPKIIKALLIIILSFIIIILITIIFISPITKYLVEKYDVKYTGRQITMGSAYVNPFTGYIRFSDLKIYELNSDSVFFSTKSISANIAVLKLFSKTYELSNLTFDHPHGIIIQIDRDLNFDDLINRFFRKDSLSMGKPPLHLSFLGIKIKEGEFYYRERVTPINYFITHVNIESPGRRWDMDTIAVKYSFVSGIGGGKMNGNYMMNFKNEEYRLAVVAQKFDLNILTQYLIDLTNYGTYTANLDADLKVKGNFSDVDDVSFSGLLAINDFRIGKNPKDDYASFDKLSLSIIELSPDNHKYLFDSVSLNHPFIKYENYDYLDNMEQMFGKTGPNSLFINPNTGNFNLLITIGNYIKALSKNFFKSDYKLNRLAIYKGDLKFNDFAKSEKFSIDLNPLYIITDSIKNDKKRVHLFLKSGIKPYGNASISLSLNPKDSSDFDLQYNFQKFPAALLNPYTISFTSFPLDRGTISISGTWNVRKGILSSKNHLLIVDPRVAKRIKNKDTKRIPVPLIMAFIRERGNVIDYEIPMTGKLRNPDFHLRDVVKHLLVNIFVKPPTIPYGKQVKDVEMEIEKSLTLKWEMRSSSIGRLQQKFIEEMADFLVRNPGALIVVHPHQYAIKEKEYILFFEAKKKYFLSANHETANSFSEKDSINVDNMSAKDPVFVHFLNKHLNDSMLFTIQDKCARFIGGSLVNNKYKQLNKERANNFISFFRKREVGKQVRISSDNQLIPYNGFSYYKIDYKGEYPKSLTKAYRKMNQLNDEFPRNLFKKERKSNRGKL